VHGVEVEAAREAAVADPDDVEDLAYLGGEDAGDGVEAAVLEGDVVVGALAREVDLDEVGDLVVSGLDVFLPGVIVLAVSGSLVLYCRHTHGERERERKLTPTRVSR